MAKGKKDTRKHLNEVPEFERCDCGKLVKLGRSFITWNLHRTRCHLAITETELRARHKANLNQWGYILNRSLTDTQVQRFENNL